MGIQYTDKSQGSLNIRLNGRQKDSKKKMHSYERNIYKSLLASIYLIKVNNRSTSTRREICSTLTIKTPERHYCRRSSVFNVNFERISTLVLVFLLLTLSR